MLAIKKQKIPKKEFLKLCTIYVKKEKLPNSTQVLNSKKESVKEREKHVFG